MQTYSWKNDLWWVSKYNYDPKFTDTLSLPKKVQIHDATLRDGEQTPGVVLSTEDKVEIARMLDDLGVDRIEAGMPAVSAQDEEAVKQIVALGLKARIFVFARAKKEDIDMAVDCGADGVIIEIPTSRPKLQYQFQKWSDQDIVDLSVEVVKYAKSKGLEVVYFGYDTTRADFDFLMNLYDHVINEGKPDSIGIVDTMGSVLPGAVAMLVREVKKRFDIKVEIHTHNDYGMAVASSFAAVEAGAEVIHTCVNGMGERTGNAAIEPVMVGLRTLYGYDLPHNLDKLTAVSDRVEQITRFKKPVNQPFVGKNVYVRESGIGIDLVLEKPLAMFAVDPKLTGNTAGIVLGKKSGLKSIEVKLAELGLPAVDKETGHAMLKDLKEYAIEHKKLLDDEEFKKIAEPYLKGERDV
jgi:methanogen homocitrate synthase